MRILLAAVSALALVAACGPKTPAAPKVTPEAAAQDQTTKLTAFLDAEFEKELAMKPQTLTRLSRKEQYDKLDDYSDAGQDKVLEWRRKSVADMKQQFERNTLNADGKMYYDIWLLELDRAEKQQKYRRDNYVFGFNNSPHSELPTFMISFHRVDTPADMEAYNARVTAIGAAIDQSTERAKAAVAEGVRMPKFQYERVIAESQKLISGQPFSNSGPDSALWKDAKAKIQKLVDTQKATPEQAKALTDGAKKALIEGMKPGYEHLIAWAKSDMGKAPSGKVGAVTLPDGQNWYAAALYLQTTTDLSADDIHKLGLSEVDRVHAEMDKLAVGAGFKDRKAFLAARDKVPGIVLPATDAGREEYLKIANADVMKVRGNLDKWFGNTPKFGTVVEREPAYSEVPGGAAHASRATPDGAKPGTVYVHLLTPTGFIRSEIQDLMCHEGIPGHLLQGDVMVRLQGVPKFKAAYSYASFNEGWALYAEGLCKEMGMYEDAYQDYARLDGELWRAVRLVVDTGLHAMGWTQDQAIKYAKENTSEDDSKITSEVKRFLTYPGQATAYKIGQLQILKLRGEAQAALGDKFDIKGFNDTVIGAGSLPLPILATRIQAWTEAQKAAAPAAAAPAPAPAKP